MKNKLQETKVNTGLIYGSEANLWGDRGGTAWDIYGNYNKWLQAVVQLKGEKPDFLHQGSSDFDPVKFLFLFADYCNIMSVFKIKTVLKNSLLCLTGLGKCFFFFKWNFHG